MGLDTTHGCWHGPYSAFRRFREQVKVAAKEHYNYEPDYEAHPFRAFMGWWDSDHEYDTTIGGHHPYTDPLDVFFVHSDCDGWIFPLDARALADALDPLVGYLSDDLMHSSPRDLLRRFIAGLRDAYENGEPVRFH